MQSSEELDPDSTASNGDADSIFSRMNDGDPDAQAQLLEDIYATLRRMAGRFMAHEPADHTLQATALVNEAYCKIFNKDDRQWQNRAHFLKLAATAMRTILIDHARRKNADKRRPSGQRVDLESLLVDFDSRAHGLLELNDALERLAQDDPELVRFVELRFFAGSTVEETARVLGMSERRAYRYWKLARARLAHELDESSPRPSEA